MVWVSRRKFSTTQKGVRNVGSKGVHAKFVQELLGHATIAVTLDTYSHVLPGMGNQAANAMEDALS
jgi:integrase